MALCRSIKNNMRILAGFINMPWAVWRHQGEKWSTQSLTGSTWLCLSSLFIVLATISGCILNMAWLPFRIMEAFISDVSSKLSFEGQPWVRICSMWAVSISSTWGNVIQDLEDVPISTNVLALDVPDYHSRVQGVMNGTGSCHVYSGRLDLCWFRIDKSWFLQCTEIQLIQFSDVTDHFSVERIDFGEVRDIFIRQNDLEDLRSLTIMWSSLKSLTQCWWFGLGFIEHPQTSCKMVG